MSEQDEIARLRALWCEEKSKAMTFHAEVERLRAEVAALKAAAKPLAERKVVQLIVLPQEGQTSNELYALRDDGTIWQRYEPQGWTQRLGIPQPEQPEQEAKP
jgi:hypothetical protein